MPVLDGSRVSYKPIEYVIITLPICSRVFGVAPCTASGVQCYNSYHTCKDRANYNQTSVFYGFCSADSGLTGYLPYIKAINYLPTEIADSFAVSGRVKIEMADDTQIPSYTDPYSAIRATKSAGSIWKSMISRYPNFRGKKVDIYQSFEGGAPVLRWSGTIDDITIKADGGVIIEAIDPVRSMKDTYLPEKREVKLSANVSSASTSLPCRTASLTTGYEYWRAGDEIVRITSRNTAINTIYCERGQFETDVSSYAQNEKVTPVWVSGRYIEGCYNIMAANPFYVMETLLLPLAGMTTDQIDSTQFAHYSTWPTTDGDVFAVVAEPTPIEQLYFELVDLCGCKSWWGEDQKIHIKRINQPSSAISSTITDDNIIAGSVSLDLRLSKRLSRYWLYWGQNPVGAVGESSAYKYLTASINAEYESSNVYDEIIEETNYCRWLSDTWTSIEDMQLRTKVYVSRKTFALRDPHPIISFAKDLSEGSTILTGDIVRIQTTEYQDKDGNAQSALGMIIYRDPDYNKARINFKVQTLPSDKYCIIAPTSQSANWTAASDSERTYGYLCDSSGLMPDGETEGYRIY